MPKRTALIIQNTQFQDRAIAGLPKNEADIEALAQVLGNPRVGNFRVKLLVDEKLQLLREELVRLYRAQEPTDVVLVAYFGQALQDRFGEIYLAASDTKAEVLDATGLRIGYLRDQLDRSRSGQKVVLLDCPLTAAFEHARDVLGSNSGILDTLEGNGQGRALLTSSDQIEAALEDERAFGEPVRRAFAQVLADGLASGAADLDKDGKITFSELYEFVYRRSSSQDPTRPMPRKFASSRAEQILIGSNPVLEPSDLPAEVTEALESPHDWMREGAISELERLLTDEDGSRAHAAHQALVRLAEDKTPRISQSATAILQEYARSRASEEGIREPESSQEGFADRPRVPLWAWITGGLVVLFAVGFVAGLAGVFGGPGVPPGGEDQPAATEAPVVATASPPESPEAQPTLTLVATQAAVALPSSDDMIFIPGGTYPIAANQATELGDYWIDQFEVSNREYAAFVDQTGSPMPDYWLDENIPAQMGDHPVQAIPWDLADAYCRSVDKRLPTEAEWEVAARGPHGHQYPWGDEPSAVQLPSAGTYPVGSIPSNRSFFGAFDMAANVWEWVDAPYLPVPAGERVLRGGANNFQQDMLERLIGDPNASVTIGDAGFRCAADNVRPSIDPSLILNDGFADVRSGWYQAREPVQDYFYGYHPTDFYHLQVSTADDCLAVRHDLSLADFIVEVEVFQAATDTETGNYRHGLVIREAENEFYAFMISRRTREWRFVKNNLAGIAIMDQGVEATIRGENQEARDRLVVIANGPEMIAFINGRLVSRVYDEAYDSGNLGFVVQTLDETYAHIHFDRIRVWGLPPNATPLSAVPAGADTTYRVTEPACGGAVTQDGLLEDFSTYTVREGDTLSGIASTFGLSVAELKGANGRRIQDANVIVVGQVLIIPQ